MNLNARQLRRWLPATHTWDCGCTFKRTPRTTGERVEDWKQINWCKTHAHLDVQYREAIDKLGTKRNTL